MIACPICRTYLADNLRICPSCQYPVKPERRKIDRRKKSLSPSGGVERRKRPRRKKSNDKMAWGL